MWLRGEGSNEEVNRIERKSEKKKKGGQSRCVPSALYRQQHDGQNQGLLRYEVIVSFFSALLFSRCLFNLVPLVRRSHPHQIWDTRCIHKESVQSVLRSTCTRTLLVPRCPPRSSEKGGGKLNCFASKVESLRKMWVVENKLPVPLLTKWNLRNKYIIQRPKFYMCAPG